MPVTGKYVLEIAECLQQNAKSEKATAFLIWKALLFSVVALTTISEHLHHRIYFTVANILQSPVPCAWGYDVKNLYSGPSHSPVKLYCRKCSLHMLAPSANLIVQDHLDSGRAR